ncbi:hypothetical protein P8935_13570 [Telmatobacter sp. DSM 110680]|uniref:Glycosyltransferase RgtA/B/C/D-like domain-containing protein n=1 Tax=Telmatobacter sp. DSM 110680 TaxID=3036704 RepID=A0AAU7DEM5_9BACT
MAWQSNIVAPDPACSSVHMEAEEKVRVNLLNPLKPRSTHGFGRLEAMSLIVYSVILIWAVSHHAAWYDEAQAWLLARSCTLADLFYQRLHYEGHPGLWYLLLWVEARLHASYQWMQYIAVFIAVSGMYVWLRFNPLPRVLSLLLPFTFFFLYQYAVIARSYVLLPLLAFSLMALYQNRQSSPWLFCIVASLLANCQLHMLAVAVGLAGLYGYDRWKLLRQRETPFAARQFAAPLLCMLLSVGIATATAWPAFDGSAASGPVVDLLRGHAATPVQTAPELSDSQSSLKARFVRRILANHPREAKWMEGRLSSRGLTTQALLEDLLERAEALVIGITVPVSTSNALAVIFLLLLAVNLWAERLLIALLPWALVLLAFFVIWGRSHHTGVVWVAIVCSLWMISLRPVPNDWVSHLRTSLYAFSLLLFVLQIGWTVHCLSSEIHSPYSPDKDTARYLEQLPKGARVAAFDYDSVTVNAWLPRSLYVNHHFDYALSNRNTELISNMNRTLTTRPDYVTIAEYIETAPPYNTSTRTTAPRVTRYDPPDMPNKLEELGYRETNRFCGEHVFRNYSEFTECRLIYRLENAGL